jgi:hypothetical protein
MPAEFRALTEAATISTPAIVPAMAAIGPNRACGYGQSPSSSISAALIAEIAGAGLGKLRPESPCCIGIESFPCVQARRIDERYVASGVARPAQRIRAAGPIHRLTDPGRRLEV